LDSAALYTGGYSFDHAEFSGCLTTHGSFSLRDGCTHDAQQRGEHEAIGHRLRGEEEVAGDEVRLTGFGVFVVATRAGGKGRNPQTGEEITIKPSKQPRFRPGKQLKDSLN